MKVELEVSIEPSGLALTVGDVAARLPGLQVGVAGAVERAPTRFVGRIVLDDDDDDDANRIVAQHIAALRAFSAEFPTAAIAITAEGGGELHLEAGSFGADEEEVAALLSTIAGDEHWRLLISFRIEADAHRHLLQLVERALPVGFVPVVDESPTALAIGFAIDGDAHRVANVLGCLRLAWRQEGSEVECLVEIEGAQPSIQVVATWAAWVELERTLRASHARPRAPTRVPASPGKVTVLAKVPEVAALFEGEALSWIDSDEQILCLANGTLYALPERVEGGSPTRGEIRRRGDGSIYFVHDDRRLAVPHAAEEVERRLHAVLPSGAVFSDTTGAGEAARTRLMLVHAERVEEGLELACVRALDVGEEEVFAVAAGATSRAGLRLSSIQIGHGWGYVEALPWRADETPTDLAVISAARLAITTERDQRSVLHLVERANLVHARTIALPCVAPQIVGHNASTVWITGMSPARPTRCDLFCVDLLSGRVIVETAELDSRAIDVATSEDGREVVFSTDRAVYFTGHGAPRELVSLGAGDVVTGIACGGPFALLGAFESVERTPSCPVAFVRGPSKPRLVLGHARVTVALDTPGHSPRFIGASSLPDR